MMTMLLLAIVSPAMRSKSLHATALLRTLVEGLELVGLNWRLIFVQMSQRILCAIMMSVIVCVNSLRFQTSNRVKLLDSRGPKPGQRAEDCTLDFRDFSVLNSIHERILCLRRMILQLFRRVLFAERRNLVEVHLQ